MSVASSYHLDLCAAWYPGRSCGVWIVLRLRSHQSSPCPRVLLSSHVVLTLPAHRMLGCSRAHGHPRRSGGEGHDRLYELRPSAGPHLALASYCSLPASSTQMRGVRLNLSFRAPFEVPHTSQTHSLTGGRISSDFYFLTSDSVFGPPPHHLPYLLIVHAMPLTNST